MFKMPFLGGYVSSLEGNIFFNLPKHLGCNSNVFSFGWDPIGLPKRVCMFFVDGEHSAFDSRIDTVDGSEILLTS